MEVFYINQMHSFNGSFLLIKYTVLMEVFLSKYTILMEVFLRKYTILMEVFLSQRRACKKTTAGT